MSLSPTKHRTLTRQGSSTSLNVGLSPPLPDSHLHHMSPSSSSRTLKRSRPRPRIRRGDVESSATSADEMDDDTDGDGFIVPASLVKASPSVDINLTPRRKVAGPIEPATVGRPGKKRETLAERLAAASKIKKSRSVGEGLGSAASIGSADGMSLSAAAVSLRDGTGSASGSSSSDKVVVCVRIKPTSSPFLTNAYELAPTSLELSDNHPNVIKRGGKQGRESEYAYTFDMLLKQPSKTPDLYSSQVAPLVDKAMNGFNSTVFAYGQTGSGKSFTMTGHPAELGIIPCAVDGVFDAITADMDRAFLLRVSYIEIYNETLRDLLNFKKTTKDMPVIHTNKGKVYVDPLVEEIVSTPQDVMKLLSKGNEGRKIGATDWNDRSSRSHCVFTIVIESRPRDGDGDDDIRLSRLNLIDLAGSEKAVSDLERRGEGKHINQSLLALREVINKLTEKKRSHIPYRNSKLTHLLENALGGDSNICVICTISAEEEHASETLETLKFAGRCSQVETKAKKNILQSSERALIRAKDAEIEELKNRLQYLASDGSKSEAASSSSHVSELADSVADLENRKARLKDQLAKLNGEILTSELPRLGHGLPLSPPRPKRRRISEFLGVGKPKGAVIPDRRAVSGLLKVEEDTEMVVDTEALEDAAVSSLRKVLLAKDAELARLHAEISSLRSAQSTAQTRILDTTHNLETTRSQLVSTISGKSLQIDTLEEIILDLRKSREDLLIEDQIRLDEVQRKLDAVRMEQERARRVATGDLPTDLALEKEAHQHDLDQLRKSHKIEVERLRAEIRKGAGQLRDRWSIAEEAIGARKVVEVRNLELVAEMDRCREATERYRALLEEHEGLKARFEETKEQAKRVKYLDSANTALKAEVERLETIAGRVGELEAELQRAKGLEGRLADLESEKDQLRNERMELSAEMADMEVAAVSAREEAGRREAELRREREKAEEALSDFQRKAMVGESEAVTGLRRQLGEKAEELSKAEEGLRVSLKEVDEVKVALEGENGAKEAALRAVGEGERAVSALQAERDTVRAELASALDKEASVRIELESANAGYLAKLSAVQLERETVQAELAASLATGATLRSELETSGKSVVDKLAALSRERDIAQSELVAALVVQSTLRSDLEASERARSELSKGLEKLAEELKAKDGRIIQLEASLEDTTRQLREARDATGGKDQVIQSLQADLATQAKELDVARMSKLGVEAELQALRAAVGEAEGKVVKLNQELEERRAAVGVLEKQINAASDTVQKEVKRAEVAEKEAERVNMAAKERTDLLEEQLRRVRSDLEERQTNAGSAHASLELLRVQLKGAEEKLAQATVLGTSAAAELAGREHELSVVRDQLNEKDAELAALRASASGSDGKIQRLRGEVDELTRQLENQGSVVSSLTRQIEDGQAVKRKLESELKFARDGAASHAVSTAELQLARSELGAAATKVLGMEKDLHAAGVRIEGLTKELADARAAVRASRHASALPTIHSSSSLSNLASASTAGSSRQGIAGMKDRAEIDRLEKVIEAQQAVIDDQREKIKFWSNELEKQREVVKMLTSAPDGQHHTTPTRSSPAGTRHIKAHSLSSASPGFFSPSTAAGGTPISGMPKKSLTSTFTARNLALPTSPTPLPMPMHTAQYSNTVQRKGRRVTVDHDMDVLSEASKVGMAKAIFESPEKGQTRSGVAGWSDSPKQRRP